MSYRCFVILPYHNEYSAVYGTIVDSIRQLDTGEDIEFFRADHVPLASLPESNVQKHISLCDFAIADISEMNPNVMYEVGYAAALDKPVILLVERAVKPPVNLSARHVIRYNRTDLNDLASQLPAFFRAALHPVQYREPSDTFVATAYSTEDSADLKYLINHARMYVDIQLMNFSKLISSGLLRQIETSLKRSDSLRLRLMALDPDSAYVNARAAQLAFPVSQYRAELREGYKDVTLALRNMEDRCAIRLFDEIPFYNIYRIDDVIFLGLLGGISRSRGGTVFKVRTSDPGIGKVIETFENTWSRAVHARLPNKGME